MVLTIQKVKEVLNEEFTRETRQRYLNVINKLTLLLSHHIFGKKNIITSKNFIKYSSLRRKMVKKILPFVKDNEKVFLFPYFLPQKLYVSKNICLIGNSPRLRENEYGNQIDNYETVIRFKYGQTENNEKHSGCKECIRITNLSSIDGRFYHNHPKGLVPNYKMYNKFHNIDIVVFQGAKYLSQKNIKQRALKNKIDIKTNRFYSIYWNDKLFNKLQKNLDLPVNKKHPQVGSGTLLILVDLGLSPHLYGFDNKGENKGYYWTNVKHNVYKTFHNKMKEQNMINILLEQDEIKLYI